MIAYPIKFDFVKPKVGDEMFAINTDRSTRFMGRCRVVKVGRKYFTLEIAVGAKHPRHVEFSIASLQERGTRNPDFRIYPSEQVWRDCREAVALSNAIREVAVNGLQGRFTLDQLRAAASALDAGIGETGVPSHVDAAGWHPYG